MSISPVFSAFSRSSEFIRGSVPLLGVHEVDLVSAKRFAVPDSCIIFGGILQSYAEVCRYPSEFGIYNKSELFIFLEFATGVDGEFTRQEGETQLGLMFDASRVQVGVRKLLQSLPLLRRVLDQGRGYQVELDDLTRLNSMLDRVVAERGIISSGVC